MRRLTIAIILSILPVTLTAQTYTALNLLQVVPINGEDFEVIESRGSGARGMWCAAASYAQDRLRVPAGTQLYIKTPRGPSANAPGRKGAVFTTNPKGLTPKKSYSVSVRQQGLSLPQSHAYEFCEDCVYDPYDCY